MHLNSPDINRLNREWLKRKRATRREREQTGKNIPFQSFPSLVKEYIDKGFKCDSILSRFKKLLVSKNFLSEEARTKISEIINEAGN